MSPRHPLIAHSWRAVECADERKLSQLLNGRGNVFVCLCLLQHGVSWSWSVSLKGNDRRGGRFSQVVPLQVFQTRIRRRCAYRFNKCGSRRTYVSHSIITFASYISSNRKKRKIASSTTKRECRKGNTSCCILNIFKQTRRAVYIINLSEEMYLILVLFIRWLCFRRV